MKTLLVVGVALILSALSGQYILNSLRDSKPEVVVCSDLSGKEVVIHAQRGVKPTVYGFTGKDENGRTQFFMKSLLQQCFSMDEEYYTPSKQATEKAAIPYKDV